MKKLYYGDNLEVLRKYIKDDSIDLCYIDPPFNSKRNYNQIYTNTGSEDKAQAQAFIDTWTWNDEAIKGFEQITENYNGVFTKQSIELIIGLEKILGKGDLLAYLISMTLRIAEIFRVLKPTGSFYLHCDTTASHYLKLIIDSIFCSRNGEYQNEITWKRYAAHSLSFTRYDNIADTIFFYTKNEQAGFFKPDYEKLTKEDLGKRFPHIEKETGRRFQHASLEKSSNVSSKGETRNIQGKKVKTTLGWVWSQETFDKRIEENPYLIYWTESGRPRYKIYMDEYAGKPIGNIWTDIPYLSASDNERLGYPTQKPEALLERIIKTSSNEDDIILDAYCGCGTTVAVAEQLNRNWIGIDITYQSISLILKRLEDSFGKSVLNDIELNGIPEDFESAVALAHKKDDKTRKEFEKWAVLTYSNNRAIINEKKGADAGIDGIAYMLDRDENNDTELKQVLFSVKSDKAPHVSYIRDLHGTIEREKAAIGYFITLFPPTREMISECKKIGKYKNSLVEQEYPKIEIVTVEDILSGKRISIPTSQQIAVVKSAEKKQNNSDQMKLDLNE